MKNFEGILICTDLDGTLLNSNGKISKENLDAIEYFKANGGLFTFITGRLPYFSSDVYNVIKPNAPFGCINGGGIYDHIKGEYLHRTEIPHSVLELVRYVDSRIEGIGIQVNHFDKTYFCRENPAMVWFRDITRVPNLVRDFDEIDEPIAKITFGDLNNETVLKIEQTLRSHPRANEFSLVRSGYELFEIMPKGITKGSAIEHFAPLLGIKRENIIAIGDYNNDVGMLKAAGVGIAVANATAEAKAAADRMTVSNDDHAIAKVISDIEKGEIL